MINVEVDSIGEKDRAAMLMSVKQCSIERRAKESNDAPWGGHRCYCKSHEMMD